MKKKITFNSPVILSFVFASFCAMVANYLTAGISNKLLFMTYHSSLANPLTYVRFFTHVLGHAGWSHYIGNMMYILLLGPMLEEKYGSVNIMELIGITAVFTALLNYFLFPGIALCGASGVVFAFILMTSFTSFKEGEIPLIARIVAVADAYDAMSNDRPYRKKLMHDQIREELIKNRYGAEEDEK